MSSILPHFPQSIFNPNPNFGIYSMLPPTSNYYQHPQFKNFVRVAKPPLLDPSVIKNWRVSEQEKHIFWLRQKHFILVIIWII